MGSTVKSSRCLKRRSYYAIFQTNKFIFFYVFLVIFAVFPALSAKAMATDTPSDLAIMVPKLVKINQHLPTLSFVTLRLGTISIL